MLQQQKLTGKSSGLQAFRSLICWGHPLGITKNMVRVKLASSQPYGIGCNCQGTEFNSYLIVKLLLTQHVLIHSTKARSSEKAEDSISIPGPKFSLP